MDTKRLLILKASTDICVAETSHIKTIADLIGLQCEDYEITSLDEVAAQTFQGRQYDYIYLCGHANEEGFGEADGSIMFSWREFSISLCSANWLNIGGLLFLATCRGGLKSISETMFRMCDKIDYICGPRWAVTKHDLTCGFHSLIYNLEIRGEEPAVAVERASSSTGRHFFCYDRLECCGTTDPFNGMLDALRLMVDNGQMTEQELLKRLIGISVIKDSENTF